MGCALHVSRPRISAHLMLILTACLLLAGACAPREGSSPDAITEDEFVELYARLLLWREAELGPSPPGQGGAFGDSLTPGELRLLEDYLQRTDHTSEGWVQLLTRVSQRVQALQTERSARESEPSTSG